MDSSILKKILLIISLFIIIYSYGQTLLDKAEVYYFNGKSAFQTGDYENAEKFFEQALKLTAEVEIKYPDIRYMLGWTKFYLKKYSEAEKYLKYYTDDPKVVIALNSIKKGNVREDLHFTTVKVSPTPASTEATKSDIKVGLIYYILVSIVIFFIVVLVVALIYFFILRKYSFGEKIQEKSLESEESLEMEEEVEESIPMEQILEVKIDELEELWSEYEKMKEKMDVDEEEIMPQETMNTPPVVESNIEELNIDELLNEPIEGKKEALDLDDLLEEDNEEKAEETEIKEPIEEPVEENVKEDIENIEENNENESEDKDIESVIEKDKMVDLDSIETIKPNIDVITKYNKIMSEPEGNIVVSNIKGVEELEKLDEDIKKKGGQFSKADLHNIFKEVFADKNRDNLMIE
jgi:tetratricopeptide (TPR) repeat protein